MEEFSVQVTRSVSDYLSYINFIRKRIFRNLYYHLAIWVTLIVICAVAQLIDGRDGVALALICVGTYLMVFPLTVKLFGEHYTRHWVSQGHHFLRPRIITLTERGIYEKSDLHEFFIHWPGVKSVEVTDRFLLIFIDSLEAIPIPLSSFESSAVAQRYADAALAFHTAAKQA